MKNERLLNIIGEIDDKYIKEAAPAKKQKRRTPWVKWGAVAAGVVVAATAVVIPLVSRNTAVLPDDSESTVWHGNILDPNAGLPRYKDIIPEYSSADRLPWSEGELTVAEKYSFFYLGDRRYERHSGAIDEKWIEKPIGECDTLRDNNEVLMAYKIKGVDERLLVAAGNEEEKHVYQGEIIRNEFDTIEFDTLGKLFEACDLPSMAVLNCFKEYEGRTEKGYYDLKNGGEIWRILSECKDAKYADIVDTLTDKEYIGFIISSEPLGAYKQNLYITEDGYLVTSIFTNGSLGYIYDIGEKNAQRIISFAKSNSEKGREEPYYYSVFGTVTEVGDGYIMLDDTIFCNNPDDGMVFKILTDKIVIKRELDFWHIEEGRTVLIEYKYKADADNLIDSAARLYVAGIKDGYIWVSIC